MALVGRGEDGVEALIEEERDGEVPEAMVPLIGCLDASGLRDARRRDPIEVDPVEQHRRPCVTQHGCRRIGGDECGGDEGPHAVTVRGDAPEVDIAEARQDGDGGVRAKRIRRAGALLDQGPGVPMGTPRAWV